MVFAGGIVLLAFSPAAFALSTVADISPGAFAGLGDLCRDQTHTSSFSGSAIENKYKCDDGLRCEGYVYGVSFGKCLSATEVSGAAPEATPIASDPADVFKTEAIDDAPTPFQTEAVEATPIASDPADVFRDEMEVMVAPKAEAIEENHEDLSVSYYVDDGCHMDEDNVKDDFVGTYMAKSEKVGVRCCWAGVCMTPRVCPSKHTHEEAGKICQEHGQSLCSKEELLSGICCGTGGGCDNHPVWTRSLKATSKALTESEPKAIPSSTSKVDVVPTKETQANTASAPPASTSAASKVETLPAKAQESTAGMEEWNQRLRKLEQADSEEQDVKTQTESVAEANKNMRQQLDDLAKQNAAKRAGLRNAELKNKLSNFTDRQEQLADQIKTLERTGREITRSTEEILASNDDLPNSLDNVKVSKKENEKLAAQIRAMSKDTRELRQKTVAIAQQNKKGRHELGMVKEHKYDLMRQKRNEFLTKKLTTNTDLENKLTASVDKLRKTRTFLDTRVDELKKSNAHLREPLGVLKKVTKEDNNEIYGELAKLNAEKKEVKEKMSKLAKQNLEKKHEVLTRKLAISSERKKKYNAGIEELESVSQALSERTGEIEESKPNLVEKSQAKITGASAAEVKEQNANIAARLAKVDAGNKDMRNKVEDIRKENIEKRSVILKDKLMGSEERKERLSHSVERLEHVNKDLAKHVQRV